MRRRNRDPEIIILEEEGTSPAGWLLLGAALGAGLALLFAPTSGLETRQRLADRARHLRDTAGDALDDLRDQFQDFREELVETAEDVTDTVREELGGDPDEAEDPHEEEDTAPRRPQKASAREELERRLAAARARRRAPVAEDEEPVA